MTMTEPMHIRDIGIQRYNRIQRMLRTAMDRGDIVKPAACSRCGALEEKASDGRSLLQAHHHRGYAHPLDIEWLCSRCHVHEVPQIRGSIHKWSRLTEEQVRDIRAATGSYSEIARRFGINNTSVRRIKLRINWKYFE